MSRYIPKDIERKLWAESAGKCMNPKCREELLYSNGDIGEKAHIEPYCATDDNSFENLILLCPTCHEKYDKAKIITTNEIRDWKRIRKNEIESAFKKRFRRFNELCNYVKPFLMENKKIFENYYLINKEMWDSFEPQILANNNKIKNLLEENIHLFFDNGNKNYSNQELIKQYILHINEFEITRGDEPKIRQVLFPQEINSIFGIEPVNKSAPSSVETLERLLISLERNGKINEILFRNENLEISYTLKGNNEILFLKDTYRFNQLLANQKLHHISQGFPINTLLYYFKLIENFGYIVKFISNHNLRTVGVNGKKIKLLYVYTLTEADIMRNVGDCDIIVNTYDWNSEHYTKNALKLANSLKIKLYDKNHFIKCLKNHGL